MTDKALYADYLEDIVDSGEQAIAFVGEMSYEQFVEDRKTVFAVTRAFEIIGEATKQAKVDLRIVWRSIKEDLPMILPAVQRVLEVESGEG